MTNSWEIVGLIIYGISALFLFLAFWFVFSIILILRLIQDKRKQEQKLIELKELKESMNEEEKKEKEG